MQLGCVRVRHQNTKQCCLAQKFDMHLHGTQFLNCLAAGASRGLPSSAQIRRFEGSALKRTNKP